MVGETGVETDGVGCHEADLVGEGVHGWMEAGVEEEGGWVGVGAFGGAEEVEEGFQDAGEDGEGGGVEG